MSCVFCEIVAGTSPASIVYRDDVVLAFMTTRPTAPGECLVIPKAHVDHFTDVDDDTAQQIMVVAQRIGRRLRTAFKPLRVGMVVHGFGVPHAHLLLVPQHGIHHITSDRYVSVEKGQLVFSQSSVATPDRATLDEHARILAAE
ncbi:MAG: HIT family protein [Gemmatimonadaceae bacterium]